MESRELFDVLRHRWYVPVLAVLIALGVAVVWLASQTPLYRATSQILVSGSGENALSAGSYIQPKMASYALLVQSPQVLDPVALELDLEEGSNQLSSSVTASSSLSTTLLSITASAESPPMAAATANSVARSLARYIESLEEVTLELEYKDGRPRLDENGDVRTKTVEQVSVTVSTLAQVPSAPYSPSRTTALGLALLLGLGLGIGLAILWHRVDNKVGSAEQLTSLSGFAPLGAFPEGFGGGQTSTPSERLALESACSAVRTNLAYSDVDCPPKTIAVVSGNAGEGRTFVVRNLARSMAEAGLRVCVVDSDLRDPTVSLPLGAQSEDGLAQVLADKVSVDDVLQSSADGLVTVLPAGVLPPNPVLPLASEHMKQTLAGLRDRFDVVLLDTPPLLTFPDGVSIASIADGTILVVGRKRIAVEQLDAVFSLVGDSGRLLGTAYCHATEKELSAQPALNGPTSGVTRLSQR